MKSLYETDFHAWTQQQVKLLKTQTLHNPDFAQYGWLATIREQRDRLAILLDENPSLKPYLPAALAIAYQLGLSLAVRETELPYQNKRGA